MKNKPYYKWIVLIGVTLFMFCTGGFSMGAFSIYMPYIKALNGFSNVQTSTIITIKTTAMLGGLLLVDRFLLKTKLRLGIVLSMVTMAIGFFLFSTSGSFPVCVAASAIVGLSYGIAGVTAGALMINSWFDKNVGLALGISSAGSGMTSIIWPILIVPVIEGVSLGGAFIVQAVFVAVCALLTFFMVANRPGITDKLLANRVDTSVKAAGDRKGLLVVPRKVTVLFFIAIFMLGMVIFGITGFMSIVYSENFGGAVLGRLVSAYGIALMVFKIAFGRLADKFGAEKAGFVMYIPLIVGLIGAPLAKNEVVAYITALLIGMGSPISAVGAAIYAKDLALPGIYGKVLTYLNITQVAAGLVLSLVSGFIADALGSYMYVYFILAGAAVVMAVFIEITYIVRRKCLAAQQQ